MFSQLDEQSQRAVSKYVRGKKYQSGVSTIMTILTASAASMGILSSPVPSPSASASCFPFRLCLSARYDFFEPML